MKKIFFCTLFSKYDSILRPDNWSNSQEESKQLKTSVHHFVIEGNNLDLNPPRVRAHDEFENFIVLVQQKSDDASNDIKLM